MVPRIRFKGFTDPWEQRELGEVAEINPSSALPDSFEYVDLEITKARLYDNEKGIEFYSPEEDEWLSSYECSVFTENNVYEFLPTLCEDEK